MTDTPQQKGRNFEAELANETGLDLVPGSGSGVLKLDLAGAKLRVSAKHTDHASIRIDAKMLQELDDATSGPGGVGAHQTGLIVARIAALDRVVAVIDWQDLVALLRSDAAGSIQPTKDQQRRAAADLPTLLRAD